MRKELSNGSVKLFRLDFKKVMEELRGYALKALKRGAITVLLVGSLARGDYTAFSDADVIIIVPDKLTPENPVERIKHFIDPDVSVDLQPIVYTEREFIDMAVQGRRIVREALSYGILLAGDDRILKLARSKLPVREVSKNGKL